MPAHPPPLCVWCTKCGAVNWPDTLDKALTMKLNHANSHLMRPQLGQVEVFICGVSIITAP